MVATLSPNQDEDPGSSPHGSIVADIIRSFDSWLRLLLDSPLAVSVVRWIQRSLISLGFLEDELPTEEGLCYTTILVALSIVAFVYHTRRRKHLTRQLEQAQAQLRYLQTRLRLHPGERSAKKKEVRIFMDGAFDLLHYGHMNAFRLGRSLGTHLVVGLNSDESIRQCKGAPLLNDEERLAMVSACKFVDEVVPGCPYIMNKEYLDYVIEKYSIDYVVHGDDPCIVDGKDVYATAKEAGKYRSIPRTEGVSTTDIVGRMLLMTKEHHYYDDQQVESSSQHSALDGSNASSSQDQSKHSRQHQKLGNEMELLGRRSKFFTTSRMLQLFSAGVKPPSKDARVIYIDGAWDLFHPGHVAILRAARERGDYLIVGIYGDAVVNRVRGMNLPLMNLHERVLSVLGCRYADDVLIDAPYEVTPELINSLRINEVVRGTKHGDIGLSMHDEARYRHAQEAGIFHVLESPCEFSIESIVQRIHRNQEVFQARFDRKTEAERQFYEHKYASQGEEI